MSNPLYLFRVVSETSDILSNSLHQDQTPRYSASDLESSCWTSLLVTQTLIAIMGRDCDLLDVSNWIMENKRYLDFYFQSTQLCLRTELARIGYDYLKQLPTGYPVIFHCPSVTSEMVDVIVIDMIRVDTCRNHGM